MPFAVIVLFKEEMHGNVVQSKEEWGLSTHHATSRLLSGERSSLFQMEKHECF